VKKTALDQLIDAFQLLPGIGPRSATRIAFHLFQSDTSLANQLLSSLEVALKEVRRCALCNTLTQDHICDICSNDQRNKHQLCVVESPSDLRVMEQSHVYQGRYFVLMGRLSVADGVDPNALSFSLFLDRIRQEDVSEVILATSFTPEGDATAFALQDLIKHHFPHVSITRPARGVPIGAELEFTDVGTLAHAFLDRRTF